MLDLEPHRTALFLDFDGTLVDIAPAPDAIVVPAALPPLLAALHARLDGALAVVSGRPVAEIDRHLGLELPAAGLHGLELRLGGTVVRPPPPAGLAVVRAAIAAADVASRGVLVEDKGGSIALHYRDVPERGAETVTFARGLAEADPELVALAGKMVVEIKPKAASKAVAVHRFMTEPPFAGRRPVFVGDDVTDEDGMRAALAGGGRAVKVGPGVTVAGTRLPDPAAVLAWLGRLLPERT